MSDIKSYAASDAGVTKDGYAETIWMKGNKTKDNSYFVCQYRDDLHTIEGSREPVIFCLKEEKVLASKDECNLDCEEYGYCETCRGFSAVGCDVCVIPRAGRKG